MICFGRCCSWPGDANANMGGFRWRVETPRMLMLWKLWVEFITRFRAMQVPIYRLHSDRAREFVSAEVKKWARSQSLHQTFTAGDEPQSNGRCEREVGIIKARTRVLLRASRSAIHLWPLAARQAMEESSWQRWASEHHPSYPLVQWRLPDGSHGSIVVSRGNGLFGSKIQGWISDSCESFGEMYHISSVIWGVILDTSLQICPLFSETKPQTVPMNLKIGFQGWLWFKAKLGQPCIRVRDAVWFA